MRLYDENCTPVKEGDSPASEHEVRELLGEVTDWFFLGDRIEREFRFRDFAESMNFVTRVAEIAEVQDHHPDILISYNKVRLSFTTHKVKGLTRNDFIMAAKIDQMLQPA